MANWIIIYTMNNCKWCVKLKELLKVYGFDYYEKNINEDEEYKKEFLEAGFRTVPQLYFEGVLTGGYETSKNYLRNKYFEKYPEDKKRRILKELEELE